VVASNGGGDPPGWFLNLRSDRGGAGQGRPPHRSDAGRHGQEKPELGRGTIDCRSGTHPLGGSAGYGAIWGHAGLFLDVEPAARKVVADGVVDQVHDDALDQLGSPVVRAGSSAVVLLSR
jgi:hypothetical protein